MQLCCVFKDSFLSILNPAFKFTKQYKSRRCKKQGRREDGQRAMDSLRFEQFSNMRQGQEEAG
jgi:hypothetical protein